jgi:hypothetical protein
VCDHSQIASGRSRSFLDAAKLGEPSRSNLIAEPVENLQAGHRDQEDYSAKG